MAAWLGLDAVVGLKNAAFAVVAESTVPVKGLRLKLKWSLWRWPDGKGKALVYGKHRTAAHIVDLIRHGT